MTIAERDVLHTPALTFMERDRIHLVVDPEGPNWIATDARGERIVRSFDGRLTLGDVTRDYAHTTATDLTKAWLHVHSFTQGLVRQGLAAMAPFQRPPYSGRLAEAPPAGLGEVWLHTNNSCNLTCTHCLVSSHPGGDRGLSTTALTHLAREAHALGVRRFYVTGGEPFVRDDAFELIDLVTRELGSELIILTNATLFTGSRRKKLAGLEREKVRFQVSLDGSIAAANDLIRGKGTFATIRSGLGIVAGLGFQTSVTCVVTGSNLETIPDLVDMARDCGAKSLHLMWMHRRGRAREAMAGLFPPEGQLVALVREVKAKAESAGIILDNIESIRLRVNAPAGVKHDMGNAGWDSVCIYSTGKVYPSAALCNVPALVCGDATEEPLVRIWESSLVLRALRAVSLIRKMDVRADPLRFLTGGGDLEQAYCYAELLHGQGNFLGPDPYYGLTRQMVLDCMFELGEKGRSARNPRMGFDGPIIFHSMGERSVACGTDLDGLDLDQPVRTLHSNCVLAFDVERPRRVVREFYGAAAQEPKAELCCPDAYDPADIAHIPATVLERSYGCGSPIALAGVTEGETIVDLGSGGGIDCFIAARRVGPKGHVIGVDMTDPMLSVAEANRPLVEEKLGYSNVEFRRGFLESLPLDDGSVDLVTSNCVINLSPDKKAVFAQMWRVLRDHGRAVVSDIVANVSVPPALRINPRLWGECLSGALTEEEFLAALRESGFHGISMLKKAFWKEVSGYKFHSLTVRAYKYEKKAGCVFVGQKAIYHGPFEAVVDEEGHRFPRETEVEVCTDTALKLTHAPYAGMFTVLDAGRKPLTQADSGACCPSDGSCC